jgi:glycosyltransferase involved in cell wall biosynthesis
MKISVIIPVYNAEKYLKKSVESAINQEETGEVILIEDCSPDNSLNECKKIASKHQKVKLYQHQDKGNHGAGASRNLGIKKAKYDYIAFLDADDYYSKNRFKKARKIFSTESTVDGIYEAVATKYENNEAKNNWTKNGGKNITTIKQKIKPEKLFEKLIMGGYGHFHLNSLVVKKRVFTKVGFFNEKLRISQDTHMNLKLAALTKLVPGKIKTPIAFRRVHNENRITKINQKEKTIIKLKMLKLLKSWSEDKKISNKKLAFLYYSIIFNESVVRCAKRDKLTKTIIGIKSILKLSYRYSLFMGVLLVTHWFKRFLFKFY